MRLYKAELALAQIEIEIEELRAEQSLSIIVNSIEIIICFPPVLAILWIIYAAVGFVKFATGLF